MKRALVATGLVLFVGVMTHVDYHLGRSGPEFSLDSPYHWMLGLLVGVALAIIATRVWRTSLPRVIAIAFAGLFLGHGVEPVLEGCFAYGRCGYPVDAERWRIFFEFLIALAGGLVAGLWLGHWSRTRALRAST